MANVPDVREGILLVVACLPPVDSLAVVPNVREGTLLVATCPPPAGVSEPLVAVPNAREGVELVVPCPPPTARPSPTGGYDPLAAVFNVKEGIERVDPCAPPPATPDPLGTNTVREVTEPAFICPLPTDFLAAVNNRWEIVLLVPCPPLIEALDSMAAVTNEREGALLVIALPVPGESGPFLTASAAAVTAASPAQLGQLILSRTVIGDETALS